MNRFFVFLLSVGFLTLPAFAMKSKIKLDKSKAFFVQRDDGLYIPLDLKQRIISFSQEDVDNCEKLLKRKKGSLKFTCELRLPMKGDNTRLTKHLSPKKVKVKYKDIVRTVTLNVSKDAKTYTLSTQFDRTGMELDIYEFNKDFFNIYRQSAMVFLSKALTSTKLRVQVLEDGDSKK